MSKGRVLLVNATHINMGGNIVSCARAVPDEEYPINIEMSKSEESTVQISKTNKAGSSINSTEKPLRGKIRPSNSKLTSSKSRQGNSEKTEHKNIPPSQDVPKKTDNSNLHCPSNDVPVSNYEILYKACSLELLKSKKHLMISVQAFDAMTFLVNYCANKLDGLACPTVKESLQHAKTDVVHLDQQIDHMRVERQRLESQVHNKCQERDDARRDVSTLQKELVILKESHMLGLNKLMEEHKLVMKTQHDEMMSVNTSEMQKKQLRNVEQAERIEQAHDRQIRYLVDEHQAAVTELQVKHTVQINAMRNKYDTQIEEIHVHHGTTLQEKIRFVEEMKENLLKRVQSLCLECDELRSRTRSSEEALYAQADKKLQLALAPYLDLPKEIDGLRAVLEMRNEEMSKLRYRSLELEKQLEQLPVEQEKVTSLRQKVDNLQAIIHMKADHEKQMNDKCHFLIRKYDRESRAKKRLSMDYEQALWRMAQSTDFSETTFVPYRERLTKRRSPKRGRRSHSGSQGNDITLCDCMRLDSASPSKTNLVQCKWPITSHSPESQRPTRRQVTSTVTASGESDVMSQSCSVWDKDDYVSDVASPHTLYDAPSAVIACEEQLPSTRCLENALILKTTQSVSYVVSFNSDK